MKKVKITVMKITEYKDLMEKYENPIEHTCDMKLGQEFICENAAKPEDFCDSAWDTIKPFVTDIKLTSLIQSHYRHNCKNVA